MTNPLIRQSVRTRQQLVQTGYTDSEIRSAVKSSKIERLSRGVYLTAPSDPLHNETKHRLKTTAISTGSPQLVVSHVSALLLYGIAVWNVPLAKVHLTRRSARGAHQSKHRVVHSAELQDDEVVRKNGTLLTSVARTLIDFARSAPVTSAVIALDSALHQSLVTAEQLVDAYGRIPGRRGAPAARRALLAADSRSESVGETRARLAFATLGLPPVDLQVSIYDETQDFVGRTDFGFPGLGLLVEFDGLGKYSMDGRDPRQAVLEEKLREDELRRLGYVVLRLTWNELADLPRLLQKMKAAAKVAARRQELGGCAGSYVPKTKVSMF